LCLQVPFVDVVATMSDRSIPLTVVEFEEWGNPQNEEFYNYMLRSVHRSLLFPFPPLLIQRPSIPFVARCLCSYSPVNNVKAQACTFKQRSHSLWLFLMFRLLFELADPATLVTSGLHDSRVAYWCVRCSGCLLACWLIDLVHGLLCLILPARAHTGSR
jgi:hypothetical protein